MPVLMQGSGGAHRLFADPGRQGQPGRNISYGATERRINIGLVNNMPDSALEQTERQFFKRLDAAAPDMVVCLQLYTLPGISRTERVLQHLGRFYSDISELWNSELDALIVTGTEPRATDLREEPYWRPLADVLDWAESHTVSTILSCLAAHAAVLHIDEIGRRAMDKKCFGVFDHVNLAGHMLTHGTPHRIPIPHSRWNDLDEHALRSSGYEILCKSVDAGVGLFTKQRKSLFLLSQGHPEYESETLFKEYRRDVGRYLKRQRETYPPAPDGYFDAAALQVLAAFKERAQAHRDGELLTEFPDTLVLDNAKDTWRKAASSIFRNWLLYVSATKKQRHDFGRMIRIG